MARTVAIGIQDFADIVEKNYFYIDKTGFIKEWWESGDSVTLIARPRRFGKTLNISMLNRFFSCEYEGQGKVFEGLEIWEDEKYRSLQGTYPVISLSFANVKGTDYESALFQMKEIIKKQFEKYSFVRDSAVLSESEKIYYDRVRMDMNQMEAAMALHQLSDFLCRYYGKKVIILLDEYDTPMQEAYVRGYWDELVAFTRSMFNSTFKTNPYMERAVMTGITRVSKESVFSDLNNLKVVTTTSDEYATAFGFTQEEVFSVMEEYQLGREKEQVKSWYDGFTFGQHTDIYNPWSILNFLDTGILDTYWANTSSNSLIDKVIREGNTGIKQQFEELMQGKHLWTPIDEQIVYNRLDETPQAVWSLLLASGYLKVCFREQEYMIKDGAEPQYELDLTNYEVKRMFEKMVRGWFAQTQTEYNGFIRALLQGDIEEMNDYMNEVAEYTFSNFDTGIRPSKTEPERFYHGFVLGLMVDLRDKYIITSNGESGFGRCDVMLEPRNPQEYDAIIMEFKVLNSRRESSLEDCVQSALAQIEEKQYEAQLVERGIPKERIRRYGFAFKGKEVLIGQGQNND